MQIRITTSSLWPANALYILHVRTVVCVREYTTVDGRHAESRKRQGLHKSLQRRRRRRAAVGARASVADLAFVVLYTRANSTPRHHRHCIDRARDQFQRLSRGTTRGWCPRAARSSLAYRLDSEGSCYRGGSDGGEDKYSASR